MRPGRAGGDAPRLTEESGKDAKPILIELFEAGVVLILLGAGISLISFELATLFGFVGVLLTSLSLFAPGVGYILLAVADARDAEVE